MDEEPDGLRKLVKSAQITKNYQISSATLRSWTKKGLIKSTKSETGRYMYQVEEVERVLGTKRASSQKSRVPKKKKKTSDTPTKNSPKPFWNDSCHELSKKLWLPKTRDSVPLGIRCLNNLETTQIQTSWFSINKVSQRPSSSETTCLQYPQQPKVIQDNPETPEETKNLKVESFKLKVTQEEKELLKSFMGANRWTYNQCVSFHKKTGVFGPKAAKCEMLRKLCVYGDSVMMKNNKWLRKTPQEIRAKAVLEFVTALTTNLESGEKFEMKFRTRQKTRAISIDRRTFEPILKGQVIFKTFGGLEIKTLGNKKITRVDGAVTITATRN